METITTTQLQALKAAVMEASAHPSFVHHEWYTEYHLFIFEKIANELCDRYPKANRGLVNALVWLHDYGKMLDLEYQYTLSISEGTKRLRELGVAEAFIAQVMEYLDIFEKKMEIDLHTAPIEVQIASSSDAASHMVGPFFAIYWKENSVKSTRELMANNMAKHKKDWERKITLPEVHALMQERHHIIMEQSGLIPEKFFC